MSNFKKRALEMHKKHRGKISVESKVPLNSFEDLSTYYSPGVAAPCLEIAENEEKVFDYTSKGNLVAVVSDGSAVLGLGDIGAKASMPVMEGKSILFKAFAGIDAFPICLNTQDVDEIVNIVKAMSPTFGGVNLEDISAPRCFEIERRLIEELDIPVFHDDQHGTAVVCLAGLINALEIVGKKKEEVRIVMSGAGAAGIAITKILLDYGFKNVSLLDSKGLIYEGRDSLNWIKEEISKVTNLEKMEGGIEFAIKDADVFLGVSKAGLLTKEMVESMAKDAVIFAMANPVPEVMPEVAKAAGAKVIATGRSDYPNQVNNVLVFPGIFKGAFTAKARSITTKMKIAAAEALAKMVDASPEKIIPGAFDEGVAETVAKAVEENA